MTPECKKQWTVWWIVWAAFQIGILPIYHLLGDAYRPAGPAAESPIWLVGFVPVAISAVIRWGVLPRLDTAQSALPIFIVGLALAEVSCFLGVFIFPAHRQELAAVSVVGIFQFIPFFAARYFPTEDEEDRE